jgi:hypothetical protein
MLYEFRVYHMHPGRGPAMLKFFNDAIFDLFERNGIHVCDFFTDAEGKENLYCICAFEDRAHRDAAFAAFLADPGWISASEAAHADGPIVESRQSFFMERGGSRSFATII